MHTWDAGLLLSEHQLLIILDCIEVHGFDTVKCAFLLKNNISLRNT